MLVAMTRFLKRLLTSACFLPLFWGHAAAPQLSEKLSGVERIVVLGDSITQDGNWVADVDCWLLSQGLKLEIINLGLGSETASDVSDAENSGHTQKYGFPRPAISERLQRALVATHPDLVLACYGMNDSDLLPEGEAGLLRFSQAITHLREACLNAGVKNVVLVGPTVRECKAGEWDKNIKNKNLEDYTRWLVGQRAKGWITVDTHTHLRSALEERRKQQPEFMFTKDGVHPQREGHWLIAKAVLEQWLGADLGNKAQAEELFSKDGVMVRKLVWERQRLRFDAWMTAIGHQRPGVAGGPKAKAGLSIKEAELKAQELGAKIAACCGAPKN